MALHLTIGSLKTRPGWIRYPEANPVPTSPLADDIATAPSGPVIVARHLLSPVWVNLRRTLRPRPACTVIACSECAR